MTKTELVALLDKARGVLSSYPQDSNEVCTLLGHIDAALAAHETEAFDSATPVVEWQEEVTYDGVIGKVARLGNSVVRIWPRYDKTFDWKASVVWSKEGKTSTLDEAQRAALTAARGMR